LSWINNKKNLSLYEEPKNGCLFVFLYNLQEEYEKLGGKIQNASQKSIPCQLMGEFAVFSHTQARNHPTIIKVHKH
jgi:hypothetical protein